jgi:hypothetical protein
MHTIVGADKYAYAYHPLHCAVVQTYFIGRAAFPKNKVAFQQIDGNGAFWQLSHI